MAAKTTVPAVQNKARVNSPTPDAIRTVRQSTGLTQTEAAALISRTKSAWQKWEYGTRRMPQPLWEYFLIKADH
jgi:DNA-binding transcriptional regulator YiaG